MHEIIFGAGTHNIQLILVMVPTCLVMFPIRHMPRDMKISLSYAELLRFGIEELLIFGIELIAEVVGVPKNDKVVEERFFLQKKIVDLFTI